MVILDPYDMAFDAVGVFSLDFWLLFKSALLYCVSADYTGQVTDWKGGQPAN